MADIAEVAKVAGALGTVATGALGVYVAHSNTRRENALKRDLEILAALRTLEDSQLTRAWLIRVERHLMMSIQRATRRLYLTPVARGTAALFALLWAMAALSATPPLGVRVIAGVCALLLVAVLASEWILERQTRSMSSALQRRINESFALELRTATQGVQGPLAGSTPSASTRAAPNQAQKPTAAPPITVTITYGDDSWKH